MLCVGAMRQSHATASLIQPRNRRLLSRTNTTAAELFYCAICDRAQRQQLETRVATLAQAPLSKYPVQASLADCYRASGDTAI